MSEYPATQIPKPHDEQAFERCNEILWRCILRDKTVQLHGRRGQQQHGVDLTGIRDDQPDSIVGIQCKLKSEGQKLTEAEVRDEVAKALTFSPLLSEYVIVTTAPDDAAVQELALELSISASEHRETPVKIRIWGWGTLEREIRRHPDAIKAFDPSHTAQSDQMQRHLAKLLSEGMELVQQEITTSVRRVVTQGHAGTPVVSDTAGHTALEREIHRYADLVSSDPDTALRLLQGLQAELDDDASAGIRFRVAANIAACQFNLADEKAAAQGFIAAYELDPGNPKASAHKALGLLLLRDWDTLKTFAETQLSKQPDNALLAAHFIRGITTDSKVTDPLAQLPAAVRGTPDVAEAHVSWLMSRGSPGAWWDAAIAAHEAHPDSDEISDMCACALLERIVVGSGKRDWHALTEDERTDVEAAIGIYEILWPKLRDDARHSREEPVSVPINLIVAYKLRHQGERAVETAREALARFPRNTNVAKAAASALMERGEAEQAGALLSELDIDQDTVMMRFGVAMATDDWETVSDLVDNHLAIFPEAERPLARAARVLIGLNGSSPSDRRQVLEAELGKFQGDVRASITLAENAREHGLADLGNRYFTAARVAFDGGDNGLRARVSIASEALARRQPKIAADLLTDRLPLDQDTFQLRLLGRALVSDSPIRERAVRFFEDIAPEIRSLPEFQELRGILHVKRGVPADAVGPFSAAFDLEPSVDNLMSLIDVHQRLGNTDVIAALVQNESIDTLPGSALARVSLAHVLLSFAGSKNPLELGYEAIIDGLEQADVVKRYLGLIIKKGRGPLRPETGELNPVVATGTWVRLSSSRDESYEALVGEECDRPWGESVDSTNPFVAKALGLKGGDSFEHETASGLRETWIVQEVKPRWLQAFHYLSKNFGRRFPEAHGFSSIKIDEDDFEPVLEHVRRHSEALSQQADLYLVDGLPMALAAGDRPGGAIALADYLASICEDLYVCHDAEDQLSEALTLIVHNGRSGAVLDAFTAWFAAGLGVFPILEECLGPLGIPHSEFARIQELGVRLGSVQDGESMTLVYQGGQYVQRVITPEVQALKRAEFLSRLQTIEEACAVESVVIPDGLPELGDRLLNVRFGNAFVPAVIAGTDRLLLAEDMMMRQVADRIFGTKSIWLQPVLMVALQAQTIDWREYCEAVVQLAGHRHGFVFVNAQVLLSVFEHDTSIELVKLKALCTYVGVAGAEDASHVEVVAGFVNEIWRDDLPVVDRVEMATNVVLSALLVGDGGEVDAKRSQALAKRLNEVPRSCLARWLKSGSIRSSDPNRKDGADTGSTDSPGMGSGPPHTLVDRPEDDKE